MASWRSVVISTLRVAVFVASAALVARLVYVGLDDPIWPLAALFLVLLLPIRRLIARRKLTQMLESGDVMQLLASWESLPNPSPRGLAAERLLRATALASYGWTVRARQLLEIQPEPHTLNTGLEHRVFLEVLLSALEGNHDRSLAMAMALTSLPLPEDRVVKQRATTHRQGALAMARAFAHCSRPGDRRLLRKSSRQNPLLTWPMRYAEAQLSLKEGNNKQARRLLRQAPPWPPQSAFRQLTQALQQALKSC